MSKRRENWNIKKNSDLFDALLALKTKSEAAKFMRDLCTIEEITDLSDRWQMVKLLLQGKSYREIADTLAVSTTTVARVAHWYASGKGGYKIIAKRLKLTT